MSWEDELAMLVAARKRTQAKADAEKSANFMKGTHFIKDVAGPAMKKFVETLRALGEHAVLQPPGDNCVSCILRPTGAPHDYHVLILADAYTPFPRFIHRYNSGDKNCESASTVDRGGRAMGYDEMKLDDVARELTRIYSSKHE